jgi:hypothetical protein
MNKALAILAIMFVAVSMATAEDRIVATKVPGGPPLIAADGKPTVPGQAVVIAEIKGKDLDPIRQEAEAILALMGKDHTWWDVGPDGGFVSVVITMGGRTNTINSWYPLFKDKETIAVVDGSLVSVKSRKEKEERESSNSEKYKTLMKFLDKVMKQRTPTKKSTVP